MYYPFQNMIRQALVVATRSKSFTSHAISAASHLMVFSVLTVVLSNINIPSKDADKITLPSITLKYSEPQREQQQQLQTQEFVPTIADIEVYPKKVIFHNRLYEAKPSVKMDPEKIEDIPADIKVGKSSAEHEVVVTTQEKITLSQPDSTSRPTTRRKISRPVMPSVRIKSSSKVTAKPNFHGNSKPIYPAIASQSGWAGTIILSIRVNVDGSVDVLEILESTGHQVLDAAAILSVRNYTCRPAYSGNKAVPHIMKYKVEFKLND